MLGLTVQVGVESGCCLLGFYEVISELEGLPERAIYGARQLARRVGILTPQNTLRNFGCHPRTGRVVPVTSGCLPYSAPCSIPDFVSILGLGRRSRTGSRSIFVVQPRGAAIDLQAGSCNGRVFLELLHSHKVGDSRLCEQLIK